MGACSSKTQKQNNKNTQAQEIQDACQAIEQISYDVETLSKMMEEFIRNFQSMSRELTEALENNTQQHQ